jgi:hypothetical protein
MDQARTWKHDTDLGNRLTDQAFGLLGRDHEYVCEAGAAPVNLAGEMRAMGSWSRRTDRWGSRSPVT